MKNNKKNITSLRSFKMKEFRKSLYRSEDSLFNDASADDSAKGYVIWYNEAKGIGFIYTSDNREIFFSKRDIIGGTILNENDRVSFNVDQGKMGPEAKNIRKT